MTDNTDVSSQPAVTQFIATDQIRPSRHQARKDFNEEEINQLAVSIDKEGLLQPITVRKIGDGYELIAGERRLRAVKSLGLPTIEARVIEVVSEAAACAKGLVENLQRKDLNPIEEAEGFQELNRLDPDHWTHDEIAKITGRSRVYITQSIGLLGLPDEVKADVCRQTLSRSHAIDIARLPTQEDRQSAANKIKGSGLNREQARKLVDGMVGGKKAANRAQRTAGSSDLLADRSALPADLAWKGNEIAINRHFKPEAESVRDYIIWLTLALQAFLETRPGSSTQAAGHPSDASLLTASRSLQSEVKARLPQTPEEEAELLAIAQKDGPKAVYGWIFGNDPVMLNAVPFATWEEAGMSPAAGLKQILDGIRKFAAT